MRPSPTPERRVVPKPSATTFVGGVAVCVLTGAVLHGAGVGRGREPATTPVVSVREHVVDVRQPAVMPLPIVSTGSSPTPVSAPVLSHRAPPSTFESPTACVKSVLGGIDLPRGSLDILCEKTDLWSIDRVAYVRIASLRGEGARTWERLGRYTLGAVAVLRSRCCTVSKPLQAVVPGLWCGILRDRLTDLERSPDARRVRAFTSTMDCLMSRQVKTPQHWLEVPRRVSQDALEGLLTMLQGPLRTP